MKRDKIVLVLLALSMIMCPAVFAAGSEEEADSVELDLWTLSSRSEFTEMMAPVFMELNPDVTVTYSFNGGNDQMQNLRVAASAGTLPEMWFNWGGTLCSFYVENGLSMDMSDYAAANDWSSFFGQSALDLATFDGRLSGYPTAMNGVGIFYRADIFASSGLSEPTTFAQWENVLATLKADGYTPLVLCGLNGFHVARYVENLIEMYAGSDLRDSMYALDASWDNPAVVSAFEKFKEHVDAGYFPEGFVTLNPGDARSFLYAEEGVMDIEGQWMENNILADEQDPALFGYFKLPGSAQGPRMSGFIEQIQFSAALSDAELDAAIRFCDYAWSPESVASEWGHLVKQPIPRMDNTIPANLTMSAEIIADTTEFGTYTINDQALPQELVSKFYVAQDSVALGSRTPAEAAAFMQDEVEAWLAAQ